MRSVSSGLTCVIRCSCTPVTRTSSARSRDVLKLTGRTFTLAVVTCISGPCSCLCRCLIAVKPFVCANFNKHVTWDLSLQCLFALIVVCLFQCFWPIVDSFLCTEATIQCASVHRCWLYVGDYGAFLKCSLDSQYVWCGRLVYFSNCAEWWFSVFHRYKYLAFSTAEYKFIFEWWQPFGHWNVKSKNYC